MSEEELDNPGPDAIHLTTQEEPQPEKPTGAWQMPEPVYRRTSGHLPRGFERRVFPQAEVATSAPPPPSPPTPAHVDGDPQVAVEPQPDIIEVLASQPEFEPVSAPAGRGPLRFVLIIIALLAMVAVTVAFLFVVYYLFLASPAETGF